MNIEQINELKGKYGHEDITFYETLLTQGIHKYLTCTISGKCTYIDYDANYICDDVDFYSHYLANLDLDFFLTFLADYQLGKIIYSEFLEGIADSGIAHIETNLSEAVVSYIDQYENVVYKHAL